MLNRRPTRLYGTSVDPRAAAYQVRLPPQDDRAGVTFGVLAGDREPVGLLGGHQRPSGSASAWICRARCISASPGVKGCSGAGGSAGCSELVGRSMSAG